MALVGLCLHKSRIWLCDQLFVLNRPLTPFLCQATEKKWPNLPTFLLPQRFSLFVCSIFAMVWCPAWLVSGPRDPWRWLMVLGRTQRKLGKSAPAWRSSIRVRHFQFKRILNQKCSDWFSTERQDGMQFMSLEPDNLCCNPSSPNYSIWNLNNWPKLNGFLIWRMVCFIKIVMRIEWLNKLIYVRNIE